MYFTNQKITTKFKEAISFYYSTTAKTIEDELIIGVVEIASFKEITQTHKAFLIKAIENIASQLNIVKMNDESKELIAEAQRLEEEAKAQNQEMMENMEELKAVQEEAEHREQEIHNLLQESERRETLLKAELEELKK